MECHSSSIPAASQCDKGTFIEESSKSHHSLPSRHSGGLEYCKGSIRSLLSHLANISFYEQCRNSEIRDETYAREKYAHQSFVSRREVYFIVGAATTEAATAFGEICSALLFLYLTCIASFTSSSRLSLSLPLSGYFIVSSHFVPVV